MGVFSLGHVCSVAKLWPARHCHIRITVASCGWFRARSADRHNRNHEVTNTMSSDRQNSQRPGLLAALGLHRTTQVPLDQTSPVAQPAVSDASAAADVGKEVPGDGLAETPETVPATPQDIQNMPRDERAEALDKALRANSAKPDAAGRDELVDFAKTVGWLRTDHCLAGLKAVLKLVETRPPEERPELIVALADQLKTFAPQEGDFPEPTPDQVSALEALLQTTSDYLEPQQRANVVDALREALGGACGGGLFYAGMLTVEEAVEEAKPTADMGSFLERLNALSTQPVPAAT